MIQQGPWAEPRGAYAILALLALGALGATMTPGGWRNRSRRSRRVIAVAVLLGAALSLLWPQFTRERALDLNPGLPNMTQITGTWRDGRDTLVLLRDGTYACRSAQCTGFGSAGTWSGATNGSLVARSRDGKEVRWHIVTYHGRYRLAMLPDRDAGATWEGQLSFERIAP